MTPPIVPVEEGTLKVKGTVIGVIVLDTSVVIGVDSRVSILLKEKDDKGKECLFYKVVSDECVKLYKIVEESPGVSPVMITVCGNVRRHDHLREHLEKKTTAGIIKIKELVDATTEWFEMMDKVTKKEDKEKYFLRVYMVGFDENYCACVCYMLGDDVPFPKLFHCAGEVDSMGSGYSEAMDKLNMWKRDGDYNDSKSALDYMKSALVDAALRQNSCGGFLSVAEVNIDKVNVESTHTVKHLSTIMSGSSDNTIFFLSCHPLSTVSYKTVGEYFEKDGSLKHKTRRPHYLGNARNIELELEKDWHMFQVKFTLETTEEYLGSKELTTIQNGEDSGMVGTVSYAGKNFFVIPGDYSTLVKTISLLKQFN